VELEDVLGGARFSWSKGAAPSASRSGAIVEARVVWDGADPLFTKTFFGFTRATPAPRFLNLVDDSLMTGAGRDEIMGKLSQLYLRWHRHGHLNAGRIYKGGFHWQYGWSCGPVAGLRAGHRSRRPLGAGGLMPVAPPIRDGNLHIDEGAALGAEVEIGLLVRAWTKGAGLRSVVAGRRCGFWARMAATPMGSRPLASQAFQV